MIEPRGIRTDMSNWFPKIEASGLPVPRTILLEMPRDVQLAMSLAPPEEYESGEKTVPVQPFFDELHRAASNLGYPVFLRSGLTSNKHSWSSTCYLTQQEDIPSHVANIVEFSELCDFVGLDYSVWAVREMLPTIPWGVCKAYGDMPICREFRFFVDGDNLECWHPYWPEEALQKGAAEFTDPKFDYLEFVGLSTHDLRHLSHVARTAGAVLGGRWSVDLLETERGWFLTDMAEADKSFHWPDCKVAEGRAA